MKVLVSKNDIKKFDPEKLKQAVIEITAAEINKLPKEDSSKSGKFGSSAKKKPKVTEKPKFGIWAKYPLTKEWKPVDKDRYEWFVAGFLYYYDMELRNNAVDHQIYFKWESHQVLIYMSPAHLEAYPNITAPANGVTTDPPRPPQGPPPPKNT